MWWDFVADHFWSTRLWPDVRIEFHPHRPPDLPLPDVSKLSVEARALLDAMFKTLCEILALDDKRCQAYALHGLGHLHHPDGAAKVQAFIDSHCGEFSSADIAWLEQCRDGTVL